MPNTGPNRPHRSAEQRRQSHDATGPLTCRAPPVGAKRRQGVQW